MPINRKVQAEMDRTLKRVADGQAAFEELWQKLDATEVIDFLKASLNDVWCMGHILPG